jgi:2-C-methyl-D-erythritol 4-phosphate cytidylyltransferase
MGAIDKTTVPLGGVPLIVRTVELFERCDAVGVVVLLVSSGAFEDIADIARENSWKKLLHVRFGGVRRQDSVRLGLEALPDCEWVVVHDGARPLASEKTIRDGLVAAAATGAAVAAVPAKDTIKLVTDDGKVIETLDRRTLALVQTPQVFRRDLLERAHEEITDDVPDDAAMMEKLGITVAVFMGDYANIKVTTPEDLVLAEALVARAEAASS